MFARALLLLLTLVSAPIAIAQDAGPVPDDIYQRLIDEMHRMAPEGQMGGHTENQTAMRPMRTQCFSIGRFEGKILGWTCSCEREKCYTCREVLIDGEPATLCENPQTGCREGTGRCEIVIKF